MLSKYESINQYFDSSFHMIYGEDCPPELTWIDWPCIDKHGSDHRSETNPVATIQFTSEIEIGPVKFQPTIVKA